jgi:hypothetical protein
LTKIFFLIILKETAKEALMVSKVRSSIPSLQYLARNVVIEEAIINNFNSGLKRFAAVDEEKVIDQYIKVIKNKLPWVDQVRISKNKIILMSDCKLLHNYVETGKIYVRK